MALFRLQVTQGDARDAFVFLVDRIGDIQMVFPNDGCGILLFKSGDSVDLQLGTSEKADPKRTTPAVGDFR